MTIPRDDASGTFDDLPRASVLVRAAVLAVGVAVGGAASAQEPPAAPTEAAAEDPALASMPAWARSGFVQGYTVEAGVYGSGETEAEAESEAKRAAVGAIADYIRAGTDTTTSRPATPEQILAKHPDFGSLVEKERWVGRGDGVVHVAVRYEMAREHWWVLHNRYVLGRQVGDHVVYEDFLGGLVLGGTTSAPLVDGARVVRIGGVAARTVAEIPPLTNEIPLTVLDAKGREVETRVHVPVPAKFEDNRRMAPTCGPCCHGHCDDEMKLPGRR